MINNQELKQAIENADPTVCFVDNVRGVSDQHHIFPVEYNGPEDGLTVPLCPNCHRNVHREAAYYNKNGETGKYVNEGNYPNLEHYHRAQFLAAYIVKAMRNFEGVDDSVKHGGRNAIAVRFQREELAVAHDLKRKMGFKSLERMIKTLIFDAYQKRR